MYCTLCRIQRNLDGCIVRFTEQLRLYCKLQGESDHPSGSTEKYQKRQKKSRTPIRRNAIFKEILMDVSRLLHPRRVQTVNYKGKFQKHANGLRVRRLPWLKYAACQQKQLKKESQQQFTLAEGSSFYVDETLENEKSRCLVWARREAQLRVHQP